MVPSTRFPIRSSRLSPFAVTDRLEIGEEGISLQIPDKVIPFGLRGKSPFTEPLVPLLEHPAGRAGGRDEFHDPFRPERLLVRRKELFLLCRGEKDDPIPRPTGPVQADRRDAPPEERQLPVGLLDGQPLRRDPLPVLCGPCARRARSPLPVLSPFPALFRRRDPLLIPEQPGDVLLPAR